MKSESLTGSVGWLALGSVATRVVGAVSGIISARALGVDGRGGLAILLVIGMIAGGVLPLGLDLWAARTLGGGARRSSVVSLLRRHEAAASGLMIVVGLGAAAWSDTRPALIGAAVLLCVSAMFLTLKLGVLQGLNQMRRYSAAAFASTAVFAAGLAVLALLGRSSVTAFVLAAVVGQTMGAAWPVGPSAAVPARSEGSGHLTYLAALRFGVPTAVGAVAAMLLYRLDVLLLSWWSDLEDVGLYSVALALTEVIWVLPTAAAQALVPHASKANPSLDTARLSRVVVLLMLASSVVVVAAAPIAIPLVFGRDFDDAVSAVPLLSLAAIGVGVWKLIGHDLIARGNARARLWSGVAAIAIMIALDAVMIPRFGIVGAAAAAAVAYVAAAWLVLLAWRSSSGVGMREALVVHRSDLALLRRRVSERRSGRSRRVRRSASS